MLEAGQGFVEIVSIDSPTDEGDAGVYVKLDRSKIRSVGVPAIRNFLNAIQAYKVCCMVSTRCFVGLFTCVYLCVCVLVGAVHCELCWCEGVV